MEIGEEADTGRSILTHSKYLEAMIYRASYNPPSDELFHGHVLIIKADGEEDAKRKGQAFLEDACEQEHSLRSLYAKQNGAPSSLGSDPFCSDVIKHMEQEELDVAAVGSVREQLA